MRLEFINNIDELKELGLNINNRYNYNFTPSGNYFLLSHVPFGSEIYDLVVKSTPQIGIYLGTTDGNGKYLINANDETAKILIEQHKAKPTLEALCKLWYLYPDDLAQRIYYLLGTSLITNASTTIPGLKAPIRPFQAQGIAKMTLFKGIALLGDEMGLGKSVQAIGFASLHNIKSTLIVAPANVKLNWLREIKKWTYYNDDDIHIISGKTFYEIPRDKAFYIVNYDILSKWHMVLGDLGIELIVLDEAHYIKDKSAERTKATIELAQKIRFKLALTGTPVLNRVVELWNVLSLLRPDIYLNKTSFLRQFTKCAASADNNNYENIDDKSFYGIRNVDLLRDQLNEHVLIRRLKKDVLPELPDKNRIMVFLELEDNYKKEYKFAEEEFTNYLNEKGMTVGEFLRENAGPGQEGLGMIEKLRQFAVYGKLNKAIDWIEEFYNNNPDEKLVIFAHHVDAITELRDKFKKDYNCVTITGSDSNKKRDANVQKFQTDISTKMIIVSITAGAEGINLTAASNTVFIEPDWTPGKVLQAEDRTHRIGQESDSVTIWHLLAEDTIDIPMYNLLAEKQELINTIFVNQNRNDGQDIANLIQKMNALLAPLGLEVIKQVDFAPIFKLPEISASLLEDGWLTLPDAEAYAKAKGSKIIKQHLWRDIKDCKFKKGIDVHWVEQSGGRGGVWYISQDALDRRMAERAKGRGRRSNLTAEEKKVQQGISQIKENIKKEKEDLKTRKVKAEKLKKKRPF